MVGPPDGQALTGPAQGGFVSVINKMLRDLDRKAGSDAAANAPRPQPLEITRGTVSVHCFAQRDETARTAWPAARMLIVLLLVATALALAWFWPQTRVAAPVAPVALVAPPLAPPAAPNPAVVGAPAVAERVAPVTAQPVPAVTTTLAALASPSTRTPLPSAPVPSVAPTAAPPVTPPPRTEASAAVVAPVRSAGAVAEPRAAAITWQEAAQDTLGQAQRLWAGGSRDGAADLLREALGVVERAHGVDMASAGVVLAMLRELVRMDMAMGQDAAVVALLRRFERVATKEPDLWALRGNAGQRLGQHADAVLAYQQALRLRPGEPRWMLGAAVSLAAQGQTAAAAELAEQARALTSVSPDVLTYLRQAGVPLR